MESVSFSYGINKANIVCCQKSIFIFDDTCSIILEGTSHLFAISGHCETASQISSIINDASLILFC